MTKQERCGPDVLNSFEEPNETSNPINFRNHSNMPPNILPKMLIVIGNKKRQGTVDTGPILPSELEKANKLHQDTRALTCTDNSYDMIMG